MHAMDRRSQLLHQRRRDKIKYLCSEEIQRLNLNCDEGFLMKEVQQVICDDNSQIDSIVAQLINKIKEVFNKAPPPKQIPYQQLIERNLYNPDCYQKIKSNEIKSNSHFYANLPINPKTGEVDEYAIIQFEKQKEFERRQQLEQQIKEQKNRIYLEKLNQTVEEKHRQSKSKKDLEAQYRMQEDRAFLQYQKEQQKQLYEQRMQQSREYLESEENKKQHQLYLKQQNALEIQEEMKRQQYHNQRYLEMERLEQERQQTQKMQAERNRQELLVQIDHRKAERLKEHENDKLLLAQQEEQERKKEQSKQLELAKMRQYQQQREQMGYNLYQLEEQRLAELELSEKKWQYRKQQELENKASLEAIQKEHRKLQQIAALDQQIKEKQQLEQHRQLANQQQTEQFTLDNLQSEAQYTMEMERTKRLQEQYRLDLELQIQNNAIVSPSNMSPHEKLINNKTLQGFYTKQNQFLEQTQLPNINTSFQQQNQMFSSVHQQQQFQPHKPSNIQLPSPKSPNSLRPVGFGNQLFSPIGKR